MSTIMGLSQNCKRMNRGQNTKNAQTATYFIFIVCDVCEGGRSWKYLEVIVTWMSWFLKILTEVSGDLMRSWSFILYRDSNHGCVCSERGELWNVNEIPRTMGGKITEPWRQRFVVRGNKHTHKGQETCRKEWLAVNRYVCAIMLLKSLASCIHLGCVISIYL